MASMAAWASSVESWQSRMMPAQWRAPPTPDVEEADRVCMPATKRQRLAESSPGPLAATVSRTLYLL